MFTIHKELNIEIELFLLFPDYTADLVITRRSNPVV